MSVCVSVFGVVGIIWPSQAHCWHIYGLILDKFNYFASMQLVFGGRRSEWALQAYMENMSLSFEREQQKMYADEQTRLSIS